MKSKLLTLLAALAVSMLCITMAAAAEKAPAAKAPEAKAPAAKAPAAREDPCVAAPKGGGKDSGFMQKHESFLKRGKEGKVGLLFVGDSITAGWAGAGKEVWEANYAKCDAANFGIGGDRTQHVLWRIENGELDGISPKVVVLMIGTNNTSGDSADDIAKADTLIVQKIRAKLPNAKVLLLAIFPRGSKGTGEMGAQAEKIKAINAQLAKLDDGKAVRYLDIGAKFIVDGKLPPEIMPDALHLSKKGYEIWAAAIQPMLDEMMK